MDFWDYICIVMAEQSSGDWDLMASKAQNSLFLVIFKRSLLIPKLAYGIQARQLELREFRNQNTVGNLGGRKEQMVSVALPPSEEICSPPSLFHSDLKFQSDGAWLVWLRVHAHSLTIGMRMEGTLVNIPPKRLSKKSRCSLLEQPQQDKIIAKPVAFCFQRYTVAICYLVTFRGCWVVVDTYLTPWPLVIKIEWTPHYGVCSHSSQCQFPSLQLCAVQADHTQSCTISCQRSPAPWQALDFSFKDFFWFSTKFQNCFQSVLNGAKLAMSKWDHRGISACPKRWKECRLGSIGLLSILSLVCVQPPRSGVSNMKFKSIQSVTMERLIISNRSQCKKHFTFVLSRRLMLNRIGDVGYFQAWKIQAWIWM